MMFPKIIKLKTVICIACSPKKTHYRKKKTKRSRNIITFQQKDNKKISL